MIKEPQDITCCVVDRGAFFSVAMRLARTYKQVYVQIPNGEAGETIARNCLGWGVPGIIPIREFWPLKNEIDLFVFPDCRDWGLQMELQDQGFPVWGSRQAEDIEGLRGKWLEVAQEIGLPQPHTEKIVGLENLRAHLYEHRDETKFVKFSRCRGDMETWCAQAGGWQFTRNKLDGLAHLWRGLQDLITFYVQDPVETDIEGGADTYFVGDFPDQVILGYEAKDHGYLGAVTDRGDMPDEIWKPCELIAPVLRSFGYRNFFSTEVRVKDGESWLLDPCCRTASPGGEHQLEMIENFPEVVLYGAHGQLLQPEYAAKYCGQTVIKWAGDPEAPRTLEVPPGIEHLVKVCACAKVDGIYQFPQWQDPECLAFVVGMGDTPDEVIDQLKEIREQLSSQPIHIEMEPIAQLIHQIKEAEELGMEFGEEKLPQPAAVLD